MTASRIVLWRHGRTVWNAEGRFQGQADVPLDALGLAQARRAAPMVAGFEPVALYSSDLSRAYQTAEALAAVTGLEIVTDKRLREIDVGTWEGLVGAEIREQDPELAAGVWRGEDVRRSPTGESPSEVATRMVEVLTETADAWPDGSVVVVATHGLAGRVGARHLVGLPFESWRLLGGMANCGWISLDRHRTGGYWRIEAYNAVATVEELGPE